MKRTINRATIQDIARELNINPSTVSRALNGHDAISPATKKRVSKAAKRMNYHPNKIASSLRLGKSGIIGVLIPSTEITFFGSVINGIEKVANENNCSVLIFQSNELTESEKQGVSVFLQSQVDGVFVSLSKETTCLDHYKQLIKRGVPLIFFDRADDSLKVPSVVVDDYKGAFNATCHLIDQGCRDIAHIAGQQHVTIFKQRLKGYQDALASRGLKARKDYIVYGNITTESGQQCMNRLLSLPRQPDGVFTVEDFTALGALQALKEAGKKVPEDVALVGFANEAFSNFLTPSLSSVDQQPKVMGEEAAKLFFRLSSADGFYKENPVKLVLEPQLVIRESSLKTVNDQPIINSVSTKIKHLLM